MRTAQQTLDEQFLEMRWRCLSLAADLDRVQNAAGGSDVLATDSRLIKLQQAFAILMGSSADRALRVQTLFSDRSK